MNKLILRLTKKKFPNNPDKSSSLITSWSQIELILYDQNRLVSLVNIQWECLPLIEWFVENQNNIASENFYVLGEKTHLGEGIAQAMYRIRLDKFLDPPKEENVFSEWTKEYDGYHRRHSLLTEMGGSKMKNIFLGCNHGKGEVSLYSETENWRYEFDMKDFIFSFRAEIKKILHDEIETKKNDSVNSYTRSLLAGLNIEIDNICS